MSTPPETAGSREDGAGQHDVGKLETSEAWGNVDECIARDRLLLEYPERATELANLRAQRNCQVCFDLDIPGHYNDYVYKMDKARTLKLDASTYSYFCPSGLRIPLVLLESTAKAGCPSCELLRKILRTRPDTEIFLHTDENWHYDYVWIYPRTYPFSQSNTIVMIAHKDTPGICFYMEPGCKTTSLRIKPSSNHPWPTSRLSPRDVADFVKPCIKECISSHPDCWSSKEWNGHTRYVYLPTRVIAVLDDEGSAINPVLVPSHLVSTTNSDSRRYIALSHCWGQSQPITTTANNYDEHLKSIPWSGLPQTFQDTILVVRALGVRFLWIDSLCIVQDDRKDWANEASKMADVYKNAWLTIAATSAADGTQGLLMDRPSPQKLRTSDNEVSLLIRPIFKGNLWVSGYRNPIENTSFPLLSRGWTLQEHMLSTRVMHCTRDELVFECRESMCCECDPNMVPGAIDTCHKPPHDWSMFNGGTMVWYDLRVGHPYLQWYALIGEYSTRRLTYDSDIFPALSGLAKDFQDQASPDPGRYLAGLWEHDLLKGMLWHTPHSTSEVPRRRAGNPLSSPPSWSWASRSSPIQWALNKLQHSEDRAEVLHVSCNRSTADDNGMVTGGRLTLRGKLRPFTIKYTAGDSFPTIYLMDEYGMQLPESTSVFEHDLDETLSSTSQSSDSYEPWERWLDAASELEQKDGLYLDVPLRFARKDVRPGIVLYYLPLLQGEDNGIEFGIVIRRLPERSEHLKGKEGGKTSSLFTRVGYFQLKCNFDQWFELEDTVVTIV